MEESILEHATVAVPAQWLAISRVPPDIAINSGNLRENESITANPVGILGVESHEPVEKDVGNRCHTPGAV